MGLSGPSYHQVSNQRVCDRYGDYSQFSQRTLLRNNAAQAVAAIAAIELPQNQWPDLITGLLHNVSSTQDVALKQASLQAIGYICETIVRMNLSNFNVFFFNYSHPPFKDPNVLATQANAILTAVAQGARKVKTIICVV